MKIIRNYILREFLTSFLLSFLFLSLILLLGNLMQISDLVIRKGVNIFDAFTLLSVAIPYLVIYVMPMSFLFGVLLTMGRLISDNEIVTIHIAGISYIRILGIFVFLAFILSLFLLFLNANFIPNLNYSYHIKAKNIYSKNITSIVEPGIFLNHFENYILYVSDKENNTLKNVFIYETDKNKGSSKVTFAQQGEFIVKGSNLELTLRNGFRDETNEKNPSEFYRMNFKIFFMTIPIKGKEKKEIGKKASDLTIHELKDKINELNKSGIYPLDLYIQLHKRISSAFSIIAFCILGFGISLLVKHREKTINFGIATLAAALYYLSFILSTTLIEYKIFTPIIGMWLPNIIITLIGTILIYKKCAF